MSFSTTNIGSALAALAAVLGLVILAGRLLRGAGIAGFRQSQRLAVLESIALDRTRSIRIVRCDDREMLLLVGGGADLLLGWLPADGRSQ